MNPFSFNWIANFTWGVADDVLRDLYVRSKYRDIILPMTVLRRFDAVLALTKQSVLDMKASLGRARISNQTRRSDRLQARLSTTPRSPHCVISERAPARSRDFPRRRRWAR